MDTYSEIEYSVNNNIIFPPQVTKDRIINGLSTDAETYLVFTVNNSTNFFGYATVLIDTDKKVLFYIHLSNHPATLIIIICLFIYFNSKKIMQWVLNGINFA